MPSSPVPSQVRSLSFPPEPASVPGARRFVRDALSGAGRGRWLDEAELLVSELATNAVLHAHTPFEVTVSVVGEGVYVQVWDDSPLPPTRQGRDDSSTTGRGLELLEALATSHGVQAAGPTKVVWFCLGQDRPESVSNVLLDRWQDSPRDVPEGCPAREVLLLGMPSALWLSAREHHNTLMREFALYEQAAGAPGQVLERLFQADRARSLVLAALRDAPSAPAVDLHLLVRPEQGAWFEALRDVLDEAEERASQGRLLAPSGPAVIVSVRRWAAGQVLDQLAGGCPVRWTGPLSLAGPGRPSAGSGTDP